MVPRCSGQKPALPETVAMQQSTTALAVGGAKQLALGNPQQLTPCSAPKYFPATATNPRPPLFRIPPVAFAAGAPGFADG